MKKLIVIGGPTAVGKTAVAIEVAKRFDTEIVSADSRQLFKEMTIGTAKPNAIELTEVKHYFINSHTITQPMNAGLYEQEAIQTINKLFEEKDIVVVTGGTGLYINAILYGMDDLPQADETLRAEKEQQLKEKGLEYFASILKSVDEKTYLNIDIKNPRRVLRALEVFELTGKPYSTFLQKQEILRPFTPVLFCLDKRRETLYTHINQRVDAMIANGLEAEVNALTAHRYINALQTVGYQEFFEYFDGKHSLAETIELIKKNTRNYAKRQLTWFKRYNEMNWVEANDTAPEKICDMVK